MMNEPARVYCIAPNPAYARGVRKVTTEKALEAERSFSYGNPATGWLVFQGVEANLFFLRGIINELRRVLGRNDARVYIRFIPHQPGEVQAWICLSLQDYRHYEACYDPINAYPQLTKALSV